MCRVRIFFSLTIVSAVLVTVTTRVQAEILVDLEPPLETYQGESHQGEWLGGTGAVRSFIFEDVAPFQLIALEMLLNPTGATTFTAELWSVVGQDSQGVLLSEGDDTLRDVDRAFYRAPISYSFPGNGDRYLLAMSWDLTPTEATFYSFEGNGDVNRPNDPPYVRGPLRILDGKNGSNLPGFEDNFLISHFRVAIVPEPATMVSLLIAWPALAAGPRRRRS